MIPGSQNGRETTVGGQAVDEPGGVHPPALPADLLGPRVRLRPYGPDDAPAVWAALRESGDHLFRWLPWLAGFRSEADVRERLAGVRRHWEARQQPVNYAVVDRATGAFLGDCGFTKVDWANRVFELGYWLRRSAEGRGYMREAAALLTDLALGALGAARVEIRTKPENTRSRRVAEALGFTEEGTAPGTGGDTSAVDVVYALTPDRRRQRGGSR
jgi:RimJ/RimL family protein N-acetyltransferase